MNENQNLIQRDTNDPSLNSINNEHKIENTFKINPEKNASLFSILTSRYMNPLLELGLKRALEFEDIYPILDRDKSFNTYSKLKKNWVTSFDRKNNDIYNIKNNNQNEKISKGSNNYSIVNEDFESNKNEVEENISLVKALFRTYWKEYLIMGIFRFCSDITQFIIPLVLYYFINFLQDTTVPWYYGVFYSFVLMAAYFLDGLFSKYWLYKTTVFANQVRTSLINTIYKKSLVISASVRGKESKGNIINLVTVDIDKIREFLLTSHYVISIPLQLTLAFGILIKILGWSAVIGIGTLVLVLPISTWLGYKEYDLSDKVMKCKDNRTAKVTEAVHNIRILKFYGWSELMKQKIMELRKIEVGQLRTQAILWAALYFFWFFIPDFVILTTFSTLPLFPKVSFTVDIIIPSLALFAIIKFPLSLAPYLISGLSNSLQSLKRIERFLLSDEIVPPEPDSKDNSIKTYYSSDSRVDSDIEISNDSIISFKNSIFNWNSVPCKFEEENNEDGDLNEKSSLKLSSIPEISDFILRVGNLEIKKNTLSIVIGPITSGKSSFLSAVIGDMKLLKGKLSIREVGNDNLTMKFGYVSQLSWVMNASIRDNILFGMEYEEEKYKRVLDICCLLNDLDSLPGRDLCEIGERGVTLSGGQNQRISIARAIYSDNDILLLDDPLASLDVEVGQMLFKNAILPLCKDKTVILVTHQLYTLESADQIIQMEDGNVIKNGSFSEFSIDILHDNYKFQRDLEENDKKQEVEEDKESDDEDDEEELEEQGKLVINEERIKGKVKFYYYKKYIGYFGYHYVFLILIPPVAGITSNYWITYWSEQWALSEHKSLVFYMGIYLLLAFCQSFGIFINKYIAFLNGLSASQRFHNKALSKVLRSPIQFFDQNLSGRIINRFSKDVWKMDTDIPESFSGVTGACIYVLSCLIFIGISAPLVFILFVPFGYMLYRVQKTYISNIREIQRLKNISLSPVISHFSESLSGQHIIRAFGANPRFFDENIKKLDKNAQLELYNNLVSNWSEIRFIFMGSCIILGTGLTGVILRHYLNPSLIGLSINYCITLSGELNWLNTKWASTETNMNAVERLDHYCKLPEESDDHTDTNIQNWPSSGEIEFQNYSMRYRDDLPMSLENISVKIPGRSKIGIVGRTGAGKSSITQALFRLIESNQGRILIDGIDITTIGLMDLRQRMSIIPQNPVLFSGTLRYNLDPFSKFSDFDIWETLNKLKCFKSIPESGLDTIVNEDSSNFSVGEKQLICLSRALLRKSRIIVMDESTSAIDNESDQLIQKTIREEFKNSTVLTIAHRLNTVIDYDWIILMKDGKVEKFGKPLDILTKSSNEFVLNNNNEDYNE